MLRPTNISIFQSMPFSFFRMGGAFWLCLGHAVFLFFIDSLCFSKAGVAQDIYREDPKEQTAILQGLKLRPLKFEFPKLHKVQLNHGAVLLLLKDTELPLINLSLHFPNGMRHESIERAGFLRASLELLEKGGTKSKKGVKFSQALTELGIQLRFHQDLDSWGLSLKVIRQNFKPALALIKELLLEPALPSEELKDIKNAMLVEINKQNEKPNQIAKRYIGEILYPTLRRGYTLKKEDLSRINSKAIMREIEVRSYPKGAMYISVAGDIEGLPLKKELEQLLDALHRKGNRKGNAKSKAEYEKILSPAKIEIETLKQRNQKYRGKILLIEKEISQTVIRVASYLPPHRHPDFYALQVANYVLGGASFTSRIVRKIRVEKGLAYYAYSYNSFGAHDGFFQAGCGTQNKKAPQSLKILLSEITAMQKGISLQELSLAKDAILNSIIFQFDSAQKILKEEVRFRLHKMPPNYLQQFPSKIRSLQRKDITALGPYWKRSELYVVLVGPSSLKKELEQIAPVIIKKTGETLF